MIKYRSIYDKFYFVVILSLLLCINISIKGDEDSKSNNTCNLSVEELKTMIKGDRASFIVSAIYNYDCLGERILNNIRSGNKDWIELAFLLMPHTDAAPSEMINLSLGESLEKSPQIVLEFTKRLDPKKIDFICSGVDVDDPRYSKYEKASESVNNRIKALKKIINKDLRYERDHCIKCLKESIKRLKKFYVK